MIELKDAAHALMKEVDERVLRGGVSVVGLSTGFQKLDEALGGFRNQALYILGGKTGMGKTSLAITLSLMVAKQRKHIFYGSLEMSSNLLALRILSSMTGVAATAIEHGRLTKDELSHVRAAYDTLDDLSFHIYDQSATTEVIGNEMSQLQQDLGGLDFATIDYISLLTDRGTSEVQRLEAITGRISAVTTDLDIPMLGVVQLNRGVDGQEDFLPTLSNIRYSDRMSHDAFAVMFCHRPAYYEKEHETQDVEDALIIVEKNRQGPTGKLHCDYYPRSFLWKDRKGTIVEPPSVGTSIGGKNKK